MNSCLFEIVARRTELPEHDNHNAAPAGQTPPPPGPQPPPNWYFQNGRWYDQPYAPDGTCLVQDDRTMAMLAHLLMLFTWFVGPLILYCLKKDESRFVGFHALQAVYFSLIGTVFTLLTCGLGGILVMIYGVILCIKAGEGRWEKYWLAGNWAMSSVPYWRSRR